MENNNCKNLIVYLLKSTIETEKTIQIQRNKVNQLYCFNSNFGYFKYIDKNKKNYIDYDDIVSFVSNFKIKCNIRINILKLFHCFFNKIGLRFFAPNF